MLKKSSYDRPKPSALNQFLIRFRQFVFPGSKNYWEKRYSLGGNSGQGSYGKSAEFKSEILNKFVRENCISSVTEYGCGDGNQLTYAEYPQYIGLDISEQAVELSSELFSEDSSKNFFVYDPNDFEMGKRNNLEIITIINPNASLNDNVPDSYKGLGRYKARKKVVEELESLNLLDKVEDYSHQVGYSERTDTVIEPYLSKQWFLKMEELSKPALKAVNSGEIKFYPPL